MRSLRTTNRSIRPKQIESLAEVSDGHDLMTGEIVGDREDVVDAEDVRATEGQPEADVETREVRGVRTPYRPSAREITEHNLTHLNYRDWCACCVQGRGVSEPHRRGVDRSDGSEAAVCADYCFMSRDPALDEAVNANEDEDNLEAADGESVHEKMTILTVKDSQTGCIRPHLVPRKGVNGVDWIGRAIAEDLTLWGHNNCVFRSDQESSMNAVYNAVARIRAPYKLVPENYPKGDSQANGSVERANRSVKGQLRVMLIALEARLHKKIDLRHPGTLSRLDDHPCGLHLVPL